MTDGEQCVQIQAPATTGDDMAMSMDSVAL